MNMIITYIENDESKQREATAEEIEYIESAQKESQTAKSKENAESVLKAKAKADLLERLGITADEAALLVQ
jgi:hypothetical protein